MTGADEGRVADRLVALGAFHGLNPGMGWLFAVARGLQERTRGRRVLRALPPIAAGHLRSVSRSRRSSPLTASVLTSRVVTIGGGAVLVGFGLWRLLSTPALPLGRHAAVHLGSSPAGRS